MGILAVQGNRIRRIDLTTRSQTGLIYATHNIFSDLIVKAFNKMLLGF